MDAPEKFRFFQPFLFPHERILWSGQPKQGVALSGKDILLIPFSLIWGGFAIFWNVMVWLGTFATNSDNSADWFFKLWGLPFLFIGLYLIVGRLIHDAYLRKKLLYAVTDQRILVLRGSKITSLDIQRLPRLELSEHRDSTGSLAFEAGTNMPFAGMNGMSWWVPALSSSPQFFRIQDARRVYALIRDQSQT